jgi:hypothetical protein
MQRSLRLRSGQATLNSQRSTFNWGEFVLGSEREREEGEEDEACGFGDDIHGEAVCVCAAAPAINVSADGKAEGGEALVAPGVGGSCEDRSGDVSLGHGNDGPRSVDTDERAGAGVRSGISARADGGRAGDGPVEGRVGKAGGSDEKESDIGLQVCVEDRAFLLGQIVEVDRSAAGGDDVGTDLGDVDDVSGAGRGNREERQDG